MRGNNSRDTGLKSVTLDISSAVISYRACSLLKLDLDWTGLLRVVLLLFLKTKSVESFRVFNVFFLITGKIS